MSKLYDIKGCWDATYNYEFNEENTWEGKILLEEDGWFEGVVVDTYSSYTKDRLIFGIFHPDKVIELFKFTPLKVSNPFVFHGTKSENGYEGEFEIIGLCGSTPYGVTRITLQNLEISKDSNDIEEVNKRIEYYKKNDMDDAGKEFYNNSISMRNSMSQIILRNYEGRGFNQEEAEKIMQECEPVNERVFQSTEREIKKLVKEVSSDIYGDDDLPF